MESRFWHYDSVFDAVDTIRRHVEPSPMPKDGHLTNYFGVKINTQFFPHILSGRESEIEGETIPANWHSDIAEFAACLRAVELSGDTFHMVELGCGWGCWMNITGVAARRMGKQIHLVGVEGDVDHIAYARESMVTNGFAPGQYTLHHGIAAATGGSALFPAQDPAGGHWGLAPVFGCSPEEVAESTADGRYVVLPMVALTDLLDENGRLDLLHVDIQGGELDLVRQSLNFLNEHVAYIMMAAHSRDIEGEIFKTMLDAGWLLEIERPVVNHMNGGRPTVSVDGVQGWRNPRLTAA